MLVCSLVGCLWYFFFFKQKTAYEMRISDWSSDVCSSDLAGPLGQSFGKELSQDFAGALVGADQRCHLEDETFRAGVTVETRALVEDPIREPVGQHVEAEARPRLLSRSCISKQRAHQDIAGFGRSEEHTSELQSLMRISYAVFCLKKK